MPAKEATRAFCWSDELRGQSTSEEQRAASPFDARVRREQAHTTYFALELLERSVERPSQVLSGKNSRARRLRCEKEVSKATGEPTELRAQTYCERREQTTPAHKLGSKPRFCVSHVFIRRSATSGTERHRSRRSRRSSGRERGEADGSALHQTESLP